MNTVVLEATHDDLQRIENLMQFYNYELSKWYPVDFADNGLYALRPKQPYWAKTGVKPYIVRVGSELAAFAVVDDEVVDGASQFNMGYFFVARRYRGQGLGYHIAAEVLHRHPGRWEIYHLTGNVPAGVFWTKSIARITGQTPVVSSSVIDESPCTLYTFTTK
jgi:predicted acetyltransferase